MPREVKLCAWHADETPLIDAHIYAHFPGSTPRPTRGICQGIQGDGRGSLPQGGRKFKRLFHI